MYNNTHYNSILSGVSFVSFDLYDTLIFRSTLFDDDIFQIVEHLYNTNHTHISNFKKKRLKSEVIARSQKQGFEVTLDDIYAQLSFSEDIKQKCKHLEEYVELQNCMPNIEMLNFYKFCKSIGKKIIITTDIYLSSTLIQAILNKIGISYDFLFVSSDIGVTKRSGNLFTYILNYLNIKPCELLHIGDNHISDLLNPSLLGIKVMESIHKGTYTLDYLSFKKTNFIRNHLWKFINVNLQNRVSYVTCEYKFGFSVLGPFLYDFCTWLYENYKTKDIDKLLFLSREGYLLYKCYILLYPEEESKCLYISLNRRLFDACNIDNNHLIIEEYFKQNNIYGLNVGLVNNSINGTIQSILMNSEYNYFKSITGFQMIKSSRCRKLLNFNVLSYISDSDMTGLFTRDFAANCLVFEHLLFENCGTSIRLDKDELQNVFVIKRDQHNERFNNVFLNEIQNACMDFIESYSKNLQLKIDVLAKDVFWNFLINPNNMDSCLIGNFYDDDKNDKRLADCRINIKSKELILGRTTQRILWYEGYINQTRSKLVLRLYRIRVIAVYIVKRLLKFNFSSDYMS